MEQVKRYNGLRILNEHGDLVEGLNVITLLNVITFGPKCKKVLNVKFI